MNKDRIDIDNYSIFPMKYWADNQWYTQYLLIKSDESYYEMFYDSVALIIKLARLGLLVKDKENDGGHDEK